MTNGHPQASHGQASGARQTAFNDLLLAYRTAAGETPEELATTVGVSVKTIKAYERPARRSSARTPPSAVFSRLCAHFREKGVLSASGYTDFAAARAARRRRHGTTTSGAAPRPANRGARFSIPRRLTALIGRDTLVDEVCALLRQSDVALVTLIGPGGIGKTHLAMDVAFRSRDAFPDAAWWVDLAPIGSPDDIAAGIAAQIGVTDPATLPPRDRLLARLRAATALLVLDNFEHLLPAAPLVSDLLAHCAGLTVLATSRAPLRLHGEQERAVPPLERAAAGALFVRRVRDTLPGFARTEENGAAIDAICARLDDVPLALELAARQMRRFETPQALLAALAPALPLLAEGPRDAPERQQTMRATIAWSYDLLAPEAQQMLRRLAVCRGGCTQEAARALGQDLPDADAGIAALIEHGLVQRLSRTQGARLYLFEVVREYGLEQLAATGEEDDARRRHADYYLALAEEAASYYQTPRQAHWDRVLAAEQDNLRAALDGAIRARDGVVALRLVVALFRHWVRKGQGPEAQRWLDGAFEIAGDVPESLRAHGLFAAAYVMTAEDDAAAEQANEDCYALAKRIGDRLLLGDVLNNWGGLASRRGDYGRSIDLHTKALVVFEAAGSMNGIAEAHHSIAIAFLLQWDPVEAETHYEQAGVLLRDIGDTRGYALSRFGVGVTRSMNGDWAGALAAYRTGLTLARRLRDADLLVYMVHGIAVVTGLTGDPKQSAHLFGAAARLSAEGNVTLPPSHRAIVETAQGMVRDALAAPETFDEWYAQGQELSPDETLALARTCIRDARARSAAGG